MPFDSHLQNNEKNNAKSSLDFLEVEEGLYLGLMRAEGEGDMRLSSSLNSRYIHFFLMIEGDAELIFMNGNYVRSVQAQHGFLLYNPQAHLEHEVRLGTGSRMLSLFISIQKLHSLVVDEAGELEFLNRENANQKYYKELPLSSALTMVVHQVLGNPSLHRLNPLYLKGKAFEILGLLFSTNPDTEDENCPFLHEEENVSRIKAARKIVLRHIQDPLSLKELAREAGLNEYQLKTGFKKIYGTTVFRYLHDQKMEMAKKILDTQDHRVNEVAFQLGYSNPSHFISAFKKKYGITPKKYLAYVRSQH